MSKNILQVYTDNPIVTNQGTDLMYFGRAPYGLGDDTAMQFSDFAAQFGAPFTPSPLTEVNDTNVTLVLGGNSSTALLQPVSLTLGWTGSLAVARGGSGRTSLTAFTLLAGGTTTTGNMQQVSAGASGQLLQSNGPSALPSWTTATFPTGSGTLNHLLRSDGTNWVQTTSTTLDSSDNLSGLTSVTAGNLNLTGNTFSSTNTNGNISIIPNGTGATLIGSTTAVQNSGTGQFLQVARGGGQATIGAGSYINNANGAIMTLFKSRSTTIGSFVALQNNDVIGQYSFYGDDGTQLKLGSYIISSVIGSVSANILPTNMQFFTSNTGGTATLAMTISNAQVVTLANALPVTSGGTGLSSTTINQILYSSSANTIAGLSTANNGVLITSAGGVPSISSTLPSGIAATNMNLTTPTLGVASATSINFGGGALGNYTPTSSFPTPPSITIGGSSAGITYGTQTGYYSRIGGVIFFQINIVLTSIGGLTGAVLINNLPVAVGAFGTVTATMYCSNVTYAAGTPIAAIGASGTTLTPAIQATAGAITQMTNTNVGNTSQFIITGHYLV